MFQCQPRLYLVLNWSEYIISFFGNLWDRTNLQVLLIPPGPLMFWCCDSLNIFSELFWLLMDFKHQWCQGCQRSEKVFSDILALQCIPRHRRVLLESHKPIIFSKISGICGLKYTADTTGTFNAQWCCDNLDISSDISGISKNQVIIGF
jgi:hypothetical protein